MGLWGGCKIGGICRDQPQQGHGSGAGAKTLSWGSPIPQAMGATLGCRSKELFLGVILGAG